MPETKKLDLIAIGDMGVDSFYILQEKEAEVLCDLYREDCRICFDYADKIPVEKFTRTPGGNASNAAIGTARMGFQSALWTTLGEDKEGDFVLEHLEKETIDTTLIERKARTNQTAALIYKGERTLFVFHEKREYKLPDFPETKWLYITSMAAGSESLNPALSQYIKKYKPKITFNPGTFQLRLGREAYKDLLKSTTIFIVNKEEAIEFTGNEGKNNQEINSLHQKIFQMGPQVSVITDGLKGSYASDGQKSYFLPAFNQERKEATGAGDAYATSFTNALMATKTIKDGMRWGSFNASSVVMKIGPHAGLLTKEEMAKIDKDHPDYQPKEV